MRIFVGHKQGGLRTGLSVALLSLAGVLIVSAQTTQLHLVSTAWPPFTNKAGESRFALDLVEAAFGRIGVGSTTAIVDASQFTSSLLSGRFDGSAAAWKDPERERVLLFSQPYLENRLILVGRRGGDVSATTFAALGGKRIAIVEGYSYGDAVDSAGPAFVRTRTEEESLTQLLNGAVDYTLMDELVVRYITSNYPKEAQSKLQFGTTPLVTRPLYLAIRKDLPDAQLILDRFNAQIRGMIADHTYHRLLHVDWILADVDGDGVNEYVPRGDRLGKVEPQGAYSIATSTSPSVTAPQPRDRDTTPRRFYVGGNLYSDWASIPQPYKIESSGWSPGRSTASIFTFKW
jgi:polar amino acid transport system substrate-binding protein